MGISTDILKAAVLRLQALGLDQANDYFSEDNIPATIRDGIFRVHWLNANLDLASPAMNRIATISRPLQILILHRTGKTGTKHNQEDALFRALDVEEAAIKSMMLERLTAQVVHEILTTAETQPATTGENEWLLTSIVIAIKYRLQV